MYVIKIYYNDAKIVQNRINLKYNLYWCYIKLSNLFTVSHFTLSNDFSLQKTQVKAISAYLTNVILVRLVEENS